jgi:hypothetical protein
MISLLAPILSPSGRAVIDKNQFATSAPSRQRRLLLLEPEKIHQ